MEGIGDGALTTGGGGDAEHPGKSMPKNKAASMPEYFGTRDRIAVVSNGAVINDSITRLRAGVTA
jgi:hypothetical protein